MFYNVHTDGKWLVLFELELALCDVGVRLGGEVINHQVVQLRRYSIAVLKSEIM